jgi:hypothetical protein
LPTGGGGETAKCVEWGQEGSRAVDFSMIWRQGDRRRGVVFGWKQTARTEALLGQLTCRSPNKQLLCCAVLCCCAAAVHSGGARGWANCCGPADPRPSELRGDGHPHSGGSCWLASVLRAETTAAGALKTWQGVLWVICYPAVTGIRVYGVYGARTCHMSSGMPYHQACACPPPPTHTPPPPPTPTTPHLHPPHPTYTQVRIYASVCPTRSTAARPTQTVQSACAPQHSAAGAWPCRHCTSACAAATAHSQLHRASCTCWGAAVTWRWVGCGARRGGRGGGVLGSTWGSWVSSRAILLVNYTGCLVTYSTSRRAS